MRGLHFALPGLSSFLVFRWSCNHQDACSGLPSQMHARPRFQGSRGEGSRRVKKVFRGTNLLGLQTGTGTAADGRTRGGVLSLHRSHHQLPSHPRPAAHHAYIFSTQWIYSLHGSTTWLISICRKYMEFCDAPRSSYPS